MTYTGEERREFGRIDCVTPLAYKICKAETVNRLFEGYTMNLSEAGLLCRVKEPLTKDDIVWLSFDRLTLSCCEQMERRAFIYQNGVFGKVVRIEGGPENSFDIGVQFVTREEKNSSNIYPKIHFVLEQTDTDGRTSSGGTSDSV
jgi:hypothetical protein